MAMLRPLLVLFGVLTLVTGVAYPALVTGLGSLLFPARVQGSLVMRQGRVVGSELIGQSFQQPGYFWGRPSATSPKPYDGAASGGSNLGPLNPALRSAVEERLAALRAADPANDLPVPVDLVTASASGIDPHITPAAAMYQAARVARQRHLDPAQLRGIVRAHIQPPTWGVLGEARVNVLMLNLDLDRLESAHANNRAE
jgi:K+-transporting ATPase ATPase C chain